MAEPSTPSHNSIRMLIINPNTSTSMTSALKPMVEALGYQITYTFFTCPEPGIPSINTPTDAATSAQLCLPHLLPLLDDHDTFLVACYSQHPLVSLLKHECSASRRGGRRRKYVTGIFEASVTTSVSLLRDDQGFGIVSTGKVWEEALAVGVRVLFGTAESRRFEGCETTGLSAVELHELPAEEVRGKMMEATGRLVRRGVEGGQDVKAICLGCAGMVGLDEAVRDACVKELGAEKGREVHIVDGVKSGVGTLYALARGGF